MIKAAVIFLKLENKQTTAQEYVYHQSMNSIYKYTRRKEKPGTFSMLIVNWLSAAYLHPLQQHS